MYTAPECTEANVRLLDGMTPHDGRVEICLHGVWGSVCDNSWDNKDASVVCHQLGYDNDSKLFLPMYTALSHVLCPTVSYAVKRHHIIANRTYLPYHLYRVNCRGNETALTDCYYSSDQYEAFHCAINSKQAGVICSSM